MIFYIKEKATDTQPVGFKQVDIPGDILLSLIARDYGLDINEVKNIETGNIVDHDYANYKHGFISGLREALRMVYNKEINLE